MMKALTENSSEYPEPKTGRVQLKMIGIKTLRQIQPFIQRVNPGVSLAPVKPAVDPHLAVNGYIVAPSHPVTLENLTVISGYLLSHISCPLRKEKDHQKNSSKL